MAHRFVEWDGWEEGLIDTILGPEDDEERWFMKEIEEDGVLSGSVNSPPVADLSSMSLTSGAVGVGVGIGARASSMGMAEKSTLQASVSRRKPPSKLPLPIAKEKEKEQMLNTTGDYCGGRGGELGRRLEAWLTVNGIENGQVYSPLLEKWDRDHEVDHLEVVRS